jgi:hypothetical protein
MLVKQQDRSGNFDPDSWKQLIEASYGWEKYRDMQRSILAFGNVYLPPIKPREQPAVEQPKEEPGVEIKDTEEEKAAPEDQETLVATPQEITEGAEAEEKAELDPNLPVGKNAQGEDVNIYIPLRTWNVLDRSETDKYTRDSLNMAYKEGQPLGGFIRPQYIRTIKDAVIAATDIEYHTSGTLPEDVYMRISEKEVKIDELYPIIAGAASEDDLKQVLQEALVYRAMDRVLETGGWTLSDEEFEEAFGEHEKMYEGTIFPLQFIMSLHGYYMKEDYRKMFRRRLAFERMLESQGMMTDEILQNFQEKGGRLFYQNGGVKIQSLFFGIFDHKLTEMREDGYAWANERMAEALKEIEEGADFLEVAKKYENINGFDRPAEFDYTTRNDLRSNFDEKTKTIIAEGYCLSDDIFYNAKEGDILGPMTVTRGEFGNPVFKGVYLVKVIGYRSMLELNPFDKSRDTIVTDYIDLQFQNWAGRMLAQADITLTRTGK